MKKVPELRFREFEKDWKPTRLSELLEFKNGINASKEQYGKGIKFINVLDILNNDYITYDNIIGKVDIEEKILDDNTVAYGDILFQRSSETREEVGTSNVYLDKEKTATFGGFIIRGKKVGEYNPIFLNKALKVSSVRRDISSRAGGSTRYNVGQETLKEIEVLLPDMEEQAKIAEVFCLIDKKIKAQQDRVEALEEYKKGIIQKIFSQEIRFRNEDGSNYSEWKETKIGKIFNERNERGEQEFELLSVTMKDGVTSRNDIDTKDNSRDDKSNYKVVQPNDIVYNSMRMWQGASGVSKYTGIVSPAYTVLIPNKDICSEYFGYLFKTPKVINEFRKYSQGLTSDTWNLKYPLIKDIKVLVPSYQEQMHVVKFLKTLDAKLRNEKAKLEEVKLYKKYLLQKMFI